jgi:hypothetical protein
MGPVGHDFHSVLIKAARNSRLEVMLNSLSAQIVLSRRTVAQADAVRRQAAVRDHRAIFEAVRVGGLVVSLLKHAEHVPEKIRIDSTAGIPHLQRRPGAVTAQAKMDRAPGRRELQRVARQVPEDLFDPHHVREDGQILGFHLQGQPHSSSPTEQRSGDFMVTHLLNQPLLLSIGSRR